jgi:hypothetical protein
MNKLLPLGYSKWQKAAQYIRHIKYYLFAALLLFASCSKKDPDFAPSPSPITPTAPVIIQAFTPSSGRLAIKPSSTSPPDTLRGLLLQIVSQENTDGTATFYYTWHGYMPAKFSSWLGDMPAGTGIEVIAKFTAKKAITLGNGSWYTDVITNTTDADFKNSKGLYAAGSGILTLTSAGYTLPFTAQFISGSLTH